MTGNMTKPLDLLAELRVVELGPGMAGAVCGQSFLETGAMVTRQNNPLEAGNSWIAVNDGKEQLSIDEKADQAIINADLVIIDSTPEGAPEARALIDEVRFLAPDVVIVAITPFGLSGSNSQFRGGDLVTFHASGLARLLTGQVEDPAVEPPVRAAGDQSSFVAGITAACAAMLAMSSPQPLKATVIDVSAQEALACMAIRELAAPAYDRPSQMRRLDGDGNGSTVSIIPAADGFIAISPREERQWQAWLGVMGNPIWGGDKRFRDKASRAVNWNELHTLISDWSSKRNKQWIYETAQDAHVPSFPLATPGDLLSSPQLLHREFFSDFRHPNGKTIQRPGTPYVIHRSETPTQESVPTNRTENGPLSGIRVLDLSWVIAGPTCTRYLAELGADVIKVETSERSDPGRTSELHAVLGKSKRGITLNLKLPEALDIARRLVAHCDVVVENFATGVLDRLGLGYDALVEMRPNIVLMSASGLGRTGPDANRVAYGTLIQCYTGFASLNGYPNIAPRVGWAWADPLCGLRMAFAIGAALRSRATTGKGGHIDFSMVESLLATMPAPLIEHQLTGHLPMPAGNDDPKFSPHGVYQCSGNDKWIAISVNNQINWTALCTVVPGLKDRQDDRIETRMKDADEINLIISRFTRKRSAADLTEILQSVGISAAPSYDSTEMFANAHLNERGFYRASPDIDGQERALPRLPWRWVEGSRFDPSAAPGLGADTNQVLSEVLGLDRKEIARLRDSGALT